jgi:hypothetical protein
MSRSAIPALADDPTTVTPEGGQVSGQLTADDRLGGSDPGSSSTCEYVTGPSSEPSKEKPRPFPTVGVVNRAPYYRPADEHRHAYLRFDLDQQDADGAVIPREVYSTKANAERIHAQQLQAGERVTVTGVVHQSEQRDPRGKPLMGADGTPRTKQTLYAYGVSRLPDPA